MKLKLSEICEIKAGGTPARSKKQYWYNGTIPWVKIGDFNGKHLNVTNEFITEEGLNNSSTKLIKKGSILYTIFATLGEVCILDIDATTNQAIAGITIKDERVELNYLYYFLKSLKSHVNTIGRGVAQNNINLSILRGFEIPLPSKEKQQEIALTLEKVSAIIIKRQDQLEALDQLIKSRFVEMFGDVESNWKSFPIVKLNEICRKITDGKHGGCGREDDSGYYFVGAREIYDGEIHYDTAPQIPYSDFEKDYKRCNIENGDFVIVNTGATIGKTAIANSELTKKTLLQKSVALIKTDSEIILPKFLQYYYICNTRLYKVESASAQPNLLISKIKETKVILPPVPLQDEFILFIEQVDKLKLEVQKSLDESQVLFDSLMQQYFE